MGVGDGESEGVTDLEPEFVQLLVTVADTEGLTEVVMVTLPDTE